MLSYSFQEINESVQVPKPSRLSLIPPEEFSLAVEQSNNMQQLLVKLGYGRGNGSMYKALRKRAVELQCSLDHFQKGKGSRPGESRGGNKAIPLEDVMVVNSTYSRGKLKARLLKSGELKNECESCGLGPVWNGKPIVMHLDHINGIADDHRRINLRMICPNCHSQTVTYSGRNNKKA